MLGRMEYFSVSVCYILWSRRQTLVLCPLWGDPGLCMELIQRACRLENITILSVLSSWSRSKHTSLLGFTFFIELRWVNYELYVRMSICLHFLRCYSAFFFLFLLKLFSPRLICKASQRSLAINVAREIIWHFFGHYIFNFLCIFISRRYLRLRD